MGGSHNRAGAGNGNGVNGFRNSEIANLYPSTGRDKNIAGLHIAVNNALFVGGAKPLRRLRQHIEGLGNGKSTQAPQSMAEGLRMD